MGTVSELYEALKGLKLREAIPEMINETQGEIKKYIQIQLLEGIDGTGLKISPPYKYSEYADMKAFVNPTPGHGTPDLLLSGNLYSKIYIEAAGKQYKTSSDVPYINDKSLTQYGEDVFELTDENKSDYAQTVLLPKIQEYITERTGLIFE